jgi:hypothetical protein
LESDFNEYLEEVDEEQIYDLCDLFVQILQRFNSNQIKVSPSNLKS